MSDKIFFGTFALLFLALGIFLLLAFPGTGAAGACFALTIAMGVMVCFGSSKPTMTQEEMDEAFADCEKIVDDFRKSVEEEERDE